ncbi:hypothetical protein K491DRAFT_384794 [Lophiostoma macrostomum CBS 122681]|uniref:Uncharacterized protein n=1 Tax=Lophiostoma macrostomum CBS 122681 TaxID=1314788 RepID=A0A6A6TS63_9PLEO|nr:hypothetical protein K491DRAFT_384794 [Lophiostoma macrostomum CBS 122681]
MFEEAVETRDGDKKSLGTGWREMQAEGWSKSPFSSKVLGKEGRTMSVRGKSDRLHLSLRKQLIVNTSSYCGSNLGIHLRVGSLAWSANHLQLEATTVCQPQLILHPCGIIVQYTGITPHLPMEIDLLNCPSHPSFQPHQPILPSRAHPPEQMTQKHLYIV